ncbi:MAG: peptide chain release factor 1 [Candidatus Omnitrophica bacterium]|nr:peptide chain release factor 1 [Candidatus Omnitrophota bacterium]
MQEAIKPKLARLEELNSLLADPKVSADPRLVKLYAKERSALLPLASACHRLEALLGEMEKTRQMLDESALEAGLREMAQAELDRLTEARTALERELEDLLFVQDPEEAKSAIVEIRAGTGGAEASLFAADLYRMYTRYAARRSWRVEDLGLSPTEVGGFKEAVFGVEGEAVFRYLKFERGVHRVQRVPATEAGGRIHTSTVTVAVMPQAEEVEVEVDPKELRIDVFRSSGPGGQSVNTADSAVRITHVPTGLVVSCQDERSQLKNKAKAMKVLRARLLEARAQAQARERTEKRRAQIGTGDRSEKIRTYNFQDRRVTDHRINFTCHRLEEILDGNMDEIILPLIEAERQMRIKGGSP